MVEKPPRVKAATAGGVPAASIRTSSGANRLEMWDVTLANI